MELEYRRNAVFDLPLSEDYAKGRILDLRINWKNPVALADAELTAAMSLSNGQTILYSAENNRLVFLAKHPINAEYYRLELDIDVRYALTEPYLVTVGVYTVTDGPYYVQATTIESGVFIIAAADVYALIDVESADGDWFVGETVEPFNTVFFPHIDTTPNVPIISDGNTYTEGGQTTRFTNTPTFTLTSSGGSYTTMLATQYALSIQNGGLTFSRNTTETTSTTASGIQSINGITAQGGNINIKVLGNG